MRQNQHKQDELSDLQITMELMETVKLNFPAHIITCNAVIHALE